MDPITQSWYEAARAGDKSAYDRLFAQHADRATLFIRARLGPKLRTQVDSQDILQDAYLEAHRDFAKFQPTDDSAFGRWLCRIIENRLRDLNDYFSAKKRQPVDLPKSHPTGPATAADRAEHREKLLQNLDKLDEDHRLVLFFRYFEGLTAEETGVKMNRSAGAVRKLAARALTELGRSFNRDSKQSAQSGSQT